jgi:DNA-binding FadR family transcriptional regulator
VKDVVARLAINPNTVLKAYRELEHDGLVAPRPGIGTFVLKTLSETAGSDRTATSVSTWRRTRMSASSEWGAAPTWLRTSEPEAAKGSSRTVPATRPSRHASTSFTCAKC